MDNLFSSISNKVKSKVKANPVKTINPIVITNDNTVTYDNKPSNYSESPKIKSNDTMPVPEFSANYNVPYGINTLNINFPTCYHERRPTPIQVATNICDESPGKNIYQNFCSITVSPLNHDGSRYPFHMFGNTPTSTTASDLLSFKGSKHVSKNYNITEFIQPEEKNLLEGINKDILPGSGVTSTTYKRKINFDEDTSNINLNDEGLSAKGSSNNLLTTVKTDQAEDLRLIPCIPAIELKTPPHFKFNMLKNNSNSFASCFVPNTIAHDFSMYRPSSTTNINSGDIIFRSPNELKKKISVDNKMVVNPTQGGNLNFIENSKIREQAHQTNASLSQKPKISCNCKKSKCLKLYCECFILGLYCDGCNCSPCLNTVENSEERNKVMEVLKEKNPAAFKPKIAYGVDDEKNKVEKTKHVRGCNCSKTQCLKKYCECYQSSVLCSSLCKCTDCKNDDIEKLKKKNTRNSMIFKTVSTECGNGSGSDLEQSLSISHDRNSFSHEFFINKESKLEENKEIIQNIPASSSNKLTEGNSKNTTVMRGSSKLRLIKKRKRATKKNDNNTIEEKIDKSFVENDDKHNTPKIRDRLRSKASSVKKNPALSTCPSTKKRKSKIQKANPSKSVGKIAKKLNLQF